MKTLLSKLTESIGNKIANISNKNELNENKSFEFKLNKYSDISLDFSKFMNDLKNRDKNLYDALNEYISNNKSKFNDSIIETPENDRVERSRRRNQSSITPSTRYNGGSSCGGSKSTRARQRSSSCGGGYTAKSSC